MALLSQMARLGSADPVELRSSMDDIIAGFDISKFGASPTKFDVEDLYPLTAKVLHDKPLSEMAADIAAAGVPQEHVERFWNVMRENISTRKDLATWWEMCANGAEPDIDDEDKDFIAQAVTMLPEGPFDDDTWKNWTTAVKEATGRKGRGLFMPLRKALTGQAHGPDMSSLMPLLQVIKARA